MSNDITANTLSTIKNAIARGYDVVEVPSTKMSLEVLRILKQESFIEDYTDDETKATVTLSYNKSGEPIVSNFVKVSKPGQRIYVTKKEIFPVMNGRGISIISTSKGLMTGAQAISSGLGGEYICKIW